MYYFIKSHVFLKYMLCVGFYSQSFVFLVCDSSNYNTSVKTLLLITRESTPHVISGYFSFIIFFMSIMPKQKARNTCYIVHSFQSFHQLIQCKRKSGRLLVHFGSRENRFKDVVFSFQSNLLLHFCNYGVQNLFGWLHTFIFASYNIY